ncbi:hypothetical protein ABZ511_07085 [Nocardia gamkensis]|uniref:hypothetical protein n=1 Tax=Nocardia gamkensis TaxID=352869 RepID=UPI0033D45C02
MQPRDEKGYRIPGGTPADPTVAAELPILVAQLRRVSKGAPLPAPRAILGAAVEGAQVDFDTAELIETRYFLPLVSGPIAKNMIRSNLFDIQTVRGGVSRPAGYEPWTATKVGILRRGHDGRRTRLRLCPRGPRYGAQRCHSREDISG